ncbi:DUF1801 domain-containing protein [Ideonella sp. 4Y11]|uniref:DUF1801 domain-containing protein n=1 Tax=Ideonella aquatica TaxID=2824119 RepID=A0A941BMQ6_9BURK|nr:DUF1801 domain-containing protein [Ideonella aquatica]MBQ0961109.1 DUF1801 domain-containing protein [Ideonella aquatica]
MDEGAAAVQAWIEDWPDAAVRQRLRDIRALLQRCVPDGQERLSYRMPTMFRGGVVLHYAAFQQHIGLYPPVRDAALRARLAPWAGPKGNLQLRHDQPLPMDLIEAVVRARLAEQRR